ncbi:hypothetical protein D3C87_1095510 [compost metagenome]
MLEHRQVFTAIKLHGELGTEVVERFVVLQCGEDLPGQRAGVEQHAPIDPGTGAEHQVAHIVASRRTRPQIGGQQAVDQRRLLVANAADLQVGPVGRLDRSAGISLGGIGHSDCLVRTDGATVEFDPANTTVQCLDDTQQPGTGGRAQAVGYLT